MRLFTLPTLFCVAAVLGEPLRAAVPVISNVRVDDVGVNGGHSSFRVTWDTNVVADHQRIQWGPTPSLGRTYFTYGPAIRAINQQMLLSGLIAGTDMDENRTVYFCVQSRNAGDWSACDVQSVTLPPQPDLHPVEATLPLSFSIPEPSTSGCTVHTVAANLSDLQAKVSLASANQKTACQVVNIPPGASGSVFLVLPIASDSDPVVSSNVNASTDRITLVQPGNTYTDGMRVRVSSDAVDAGGLISSGLAEAADYCVVGASGSSFQLALWPECGSPVALNNQGSSTWRIMPFPPPSSNFIWIRNSSNALPPDGVRITPQWQTPETKVTWRPSGTGINSNIRGAIRARAFAHHYYIGPGIDFADGDSNQGDTTDPEPWPSFYDMRPSGSYIAIKRNWFTGRGYPERKLRMLWADGSFIDISDNYFTKMDFWRPVRTGLKPTISGSQLTIASGTYNTGIGNCPSLSGATVTLSSGSGTAFVTVRPSDCAVVVTKPAQANLASCSGCTSQDGTGFPVNAAGRFVHGLIASCTFSNGSFTSCSNIDDGITGPSLSVHHAEGPQNIIACGPGPTRIANNYHEMHSIFWHLDDSCSSRPLTVPTDVVFKRNVFALPDRYRIGTSANDGLTYRNRNQWECKRCSRVLLIGNEFFGNFADVNAGPTILINANANFATIPAISSAGDFTMKSNYIHDAAIGVQLGGGPGGSYLVPQLARKFTLKNNLLYNLDGWTYFTNIPSGRTSGWGSCFILTYGGEDQIFDHNTCYSAGGAFSVAFLIAAKMIEGFSATNNVLYFHQDANLNGLLIDWGSHGIGNPACGGLTGKAGMDCAFNGQYTFANNLLIPGFTNSQSKTGSSNASAFASVWAGLGNFVATESTVAGRIAGARWADPAKRNVRWNVASPYAAGGKRSSDGLGVGVDQDVLEDDLGWIKNIRTLNVESERVTIAFHAPDEGQACYVNFGTSPEATSWNRSAPDFSLSKERQIQLTGLTPDTAYHYQVMCSDTTPSAVGLMRTR